MAVVDAGPRCTLCPSISVYAHVCPSVSLYVLLYPSMSLRVPLCLYVSQCARPWGNTPRSTSHLSWAQPRGWRWLWSTRGHGAPYTLNLEPSTLNLTKSASNAPLHLWQTARTPPPPQQMFVPRVRARNLLSHYLSLEEAGGEMAIWWTRGRGEPCTLKLPT